MDMTFCNGPPQGEGQSKENRHFTLPKGALIYRKTKKGNSGEISSIWRVDAPGITRSKTFSFYDPSVLHYLPERTSARPAKKGGSTSIEIGPRADVTADSASVA